MADPTLSSDGGPQSTHEFRWGMPQGVRPVVHVHFCIGTDKKPYVNWSDNADLVDLPGLLGLALQVIGQGLAGLAQKTHHDTGRIVKPWN